MNTFPKKPVSGATDDPSIPVLTDRLGFPPLEFDTTLPMIDSTLGKFEDSSLDVPTLQPIETPQTPAVAQIPAPLPTVHRYPPAAPLPSDLPTWSAQGLTTDGGAVGQPQGARAYDPGASLSFDTSAAFSGAATSIASGSAAPGASGLPGTENPYWARMEGELRNAILRGLAARLPHEVESVIRTQMAPAIDRLIDALAADTRLAVAASVREIVEQTVRAELERLRLSH
jgi:hypothetical protein